MAMDLVGVLVPFHGVTGRFCVDDDGVLCVQTVCRGEVRQVPVSLLASCNQCVCHCKNY